MLGYHAIEQMSTHATVETLFLKNASTLTICAKIFVEIYIYIYILPKIVPFYLLIKVMNSLNLKFIIFNN